MPSHLASTTRQLIPASKTERDRCSRKNAGSSGGLQHVGHGGARNRHEHHFGGRHGVGDGGRVRAFPKFRRERPRPGGMPGRERDVVAGGVPEPA